MNRLRIYVDLKITPKGLALLQQGTEGHELVFPHKPTASILAKPEPDPQFISVDIAFGQPDPKSIQAAARLKWIQVSSSGITRYDTAPFRALLAQRGLILTNSASVFNEACADHALGFLLAQSRQLPRALSTRTAHGTIEWHSLRGSSVPLRGQTIVILGYGAIGRRLTELLRPFEAHVLAYRRTARGDEGIPVLDAEELIAALGKADHVIDILPDSAETRHFCAARFFEALKPGANFYNIGRGSTVDQEALLEALRSGRLGSAWLDVTDPEPLPDDHPLWAEPRCFITPHVAGGHQDELGTLIRHFLLNFAHFTHGEPLVDRVV